MSRPSDRLLRRIRAAALRLGAFTLVIDILLLVQPLYMLQVYDRILQSRSLDTLLYISILAVAALGLLGLLDTLRGIIANRIGVGLEVDNGGGALTASMHGAKAVLGDVQPLRDLGNIRNFLAGRSALAFLDLPLAPLFLALLYLIHPALFWTTLLGAVVLVALAVANQRVSAAASARAAEENMSAMLSAQAIVRNTESIEAMGMAHNAVLVWGERAGRHLAAQEELGSTNAIFSGASRAFRIALQVAILGIGGYLVLHDEMTAGMIFASSLISGRALQPIDQVIGGWRGAVETFRSWTRLCRTLDEDESPVKFTELPVPVGAVAMEQLLVMPSNNPAGDPLLKRVTASVGAGEFLAIVGPSGAGKSTLLRTLIGAVDLRAGTVRIDGADIRQWRRDQLGMYIGYLAQDVELLPGTVAQNIARFMPDADDEAIVAAARKAQVHDLILRLPNGYDTLLGPTGTRLSGGQRQRLGLARAFFGSPRILILDEPNASLDADGETALEQALETARGDGITIVIVTQRRRLAEQADKIMVLREGELEAFGERREIFGPRPTVISRQDKPASPAQQHQVGQGTIAGKGGSVTARYGTTFAAGAANV